MLSGTCWPAGTRHLPDQGSLTRRLSALHRKTKVKPGYPLSPCRTEAAAPYGAAAFCPPAGRGRQILEKAASVQAALALIEWDNETLAPKKAGEQTAKTAGALSGIYYDIMTGPSMDKALKQWKECGEDNEDARKADGTFWSIDEIASRMCCETEKERRLLSCVPREEYEEFTKMTNAGGRIWAEAGGA